MMLTFRSCIVTLLLLTSLGTAQEARFELGQRLRLFERALDVHNSPEARKRAIDPLAKATPTFFSGRLADAAGLLDRARLALVSKDEPSESTLWAESLIVVPAARLLDSSAKELKVDLRSFYKSEGKRPEKVTIRLSLLDASTKARVAATLAIPEPLAAVTVPLKEIAEGDYQLRAEILVGEKVLAAGEQMVSVVKDLEKRLATLEAEAKDLKPSEKTATEKATLGRLLSIVGDMAKNRTQETNLPAARFVAESESLVRAIKDDKPFYGPEKSGQFWLTLKTKDASDIVRVQIPPEAKKGKPLPLVVAMHGAGGSENMFFDGYGDGIVAKLCAKRGWILVTTRSPLFAFGGGPEVVRVVDALSKIYPVDAKRVYLVGHSMGAAQAVATAGRHPERFAAVAALGGGGAVRASEKLKDVRFFVGVGDKDFALNGARTLHKSLTKNEVKVAKFKLYEDVEHLVIVQLALPEVFEWFEGK
jgi:predicted esterase